MHPAVLIALLLGVMLIFALPRRFVLVPFLTLAILAPYGQVLVLGGQHLPALRVLTMAGIVRILCSKRAKWDHIDRLFLAWALVRALAFCLLFATIGALVNQTAFLLDFIGGFFFIRYCIRNHEDVEAMIRIFAGIAVVLAVCMMVEHFHSYNVFGFFGGSTVPSVRERSIRAGGPFAHPLLAGTFGATLLPLFAWLWISGRNRSMATIGAAASAIITITSASSTPLLAFAAGIVGIGLWPVRDYLRLLRRAMIAALAALHIVMKAPVWFLIARVDLVGGSSGFHRAMLIDQFIRHFPDWALIGTNNNGSWGWDMWDTCNQFVTEGYTGGIVTLVCFVWILVKAFKRLGNTRRAVHDNSTQEWFIWLLGVALLSHVVAFLGIVYFDQTRIEWFAVLSSIIVATSGARLDSITDGSIDEAPAPDTGALNWMLSCDRDREPLTLGQEKSSDKWVAVLDRDE